MVLAQEKSLGGAIDHILLGQGAKGCLGGIAHLKFGVEIDPAAARPDALVDECVFGYVVGPIFEAIQFAQRGSAVDTKVDAVHKTTLRGGSKLGATRSQLAGGDPRNRVADRCFAILKLNAANALNIGLAEMSNAGLDVEGRNGAARVYTHEVGPAGRLKADVERAIDRAARCINDAQLQAIGKALRYVHRAVSASAIDQQHLHVMHSDVVVEDAL